MNSGRIISIIAIAIGFGITALAGLFLAVQASSNQLTSGGLIVGAFLAFVIVAPLFGFGIFMYVKSGQEAETQSEMETQRRLLDMLKSRGQIATHDLAIELGISVSEVKKLVDQLVGLEIFSGYANWDKGMLYSAQASHLHELDKCKNCGGAIKLTGKGVIVCQFCGTEYFLSS